MSVFEEVILNPYFIAYLIHFLHLKKLEATAKTDFRSEIRKKKKTQGNNFFFKYL